MPKVLIVLLKQVLTSKKALATIAGLVITFGAKYGLNLDPDTVNQVIILVVGYVVGQGLSDSAKTVVLPKEPVITYTTQQSSRNN